MSNFPLEKEIEGKRPVCKTSAMLAKMWRISAFLLWLLAFFSPGKEEWTILCFTMLTKMKNKHKIVAMWNDTKCPCGCSSYTGLYGENVSPILDHMYVFLQFWRCLKNSVANARVSPWHQALYPFLTLQQTQSTRWTGLTWAGGEQLEQGSPTAGVDVGAGSPLVTHNLSLPTACCSGLTAQASASGSSQAPWFPSESVGAYGELAQWSR